MLNEIVESQTATKMPLATSDQTGLAPFSEDNDDGNDVLDLRLRDERMKALGCGRSGVVASAVGGSGRSRLRETV